MTNLPTDYTQLVSLLLANLKVTGNNIDSAGTALTATYTELNTLAGGTGSVVAGVATDKLLRLSPKPTDTYAATMTIDVTYSNHVIAAVSGTSATLALTPSAAGTAGDVLVITTEADNSGTVTTTFSSTFHSSGTQATTSSKFSTITFVSDGTRWLEVCRTTALT